MELTILAVTKMQDNHICIGGINNKGEWIRPVKKSRLCASDLFVNNNLIITTINKVEISLKENLKNMPHSEDFLIDKSEEIKLIKTVNNEERASFLRNHAENNLITSDAIEDTLIKLKRSLILIGPVQIKYVVLEKKEDGCIKSPRMKFSLKNMDFRPIPVTDLKFRALGKRLLKDDKTILNSKTIQKLLNYKEVYLAIGLSRLYKERYWAMVIGVHTIPDYQSEIDYNDL